RGRLGQAVGGGPDRCPADHQLPPLVVVVIGVVVVVVGAAVVAVVGGAVVLVVGAAVVLVPWVVFVVGAEVLVVGAAVVWVVWSVLWLTVDWVGGGVSLDDGAVVVVSSFGGGSVGGCVSDVSGSGEAVGSVLPAVGSVAADSVSAAGPGWVVSPSIPTAGCDGPG
ncbi:MAG: hypothetical protein OEV40_10625, partial [Acidimicrobiia bacterium]|nr:hypothetical protein [Acidimicrobiia bacterium]